MTACQVCQLELGPDAMAKGEAILAKGQPVCRPCADRLGIHPDAPGFPRPRATTETLVTPAPSPAARGGGVAAAVAVLALGTAGWALWQLREVRDASDALGRHLADSRIPASASTGAGRGETAEQLRQLEAQLAEAEKALDTLRAQVGGEASSRAALVAELREEARQAREEAAAARSASEQAVRALGREVADAVARALAEQAPPPGSPAPAAHPALVEQYWNACQEQVQALSRQGLFLAAAREYDRIPKRQRRPDHDALAAKARESLQRQAEDRVTLAMKVVEKRLKDNDYAFAEKLLTQLAEECGFPSVLDGLQPRLDEVRRMRRSDAEMLEKADALARDRKVRELLQALGSSDPEIQRRAVASFEALGPSALPGLLQALESPDPQIRWGSLLALSKLRAPSAVPPVIKRLKDADRRVRITAADVLAEFEDPRAVPDLIAALSDADEAVGRQAELSLERITHFAPPAPASGKPADYAPAWQAWWESGKKALNP